MKSVKKLEQELALLAMEFRGNKDEESRKSVTAKYAKVVSQLVKSGKWKYMPTMEEQLPDEYLPDEFFTYWELTNPKQGLKNSFFH